MKKILLVGNGIDILINDNFERNHLIKAINIFKDKLFYNKDELIRSIFNHVFVLNYDTYSRILFQVLHKGLNASYYSDSLENIFSRIEKCLHKEVYIRYAQNISEPITANEFEQFCNDFFSIKDDKDCHNKLEKMINEYFKEINFIGYDNEYEEWILSESIIEYVAIKSVVFDKFCEYLIKLENHSKSLISKNKKYIPLLRDKVSTYDYIITTNYTNTIEDIDYRSDFNNIHHIHGRFRDNLGVKSWKTILISGINKVNEEYDFSYLDDFFNDGLTKQVDVDIFGMSVTNDDDLYVSIMDFMLKYVNSVNIIVHYFAFGDVDVKNFSAFIGDYNQKTKNKIKYEIINSKYFLNIQEILSDKKKV